MSEPLDRVSLDQRGEPLASGLLVAVDPGREPEQELGHVIEQRGAPEPLELGKPLRDGALPGRDDSVDLGAQPAADGGGHRHA